MIDWLLTSVILYTDTSVYQRSYVACKYQSFQHRWHANTKEVSHSVLSLILGYKNDLKIILINKRFSFDNDRLYLRHVSLDNDIASTVSAFLLQSFVCITPRPHSIQDSIPSLNICFLVCKSRPVSFIFSTFSLFHRHLHFRNEGTMVKIFKILIRLTPN